jgi:hypothetical protein
MSRHLVAPPEAVHDLKRRLNEFTSRSGGESAWLIDESGALIAAAGKGLAETGDPADSASLMACNFLVTHELAKYLGDQEISVLLHEGEQLNMFFRRSGARGILIVLFRDPGALGRVRALTERLAADLGPLLDALEKPFIPAGVLADGFLDTAETVLDQVLWSPGTAAIGAPGDRRIVG